MSDPIMVLRERYVEVYDENVLNRRKVSGCKILTYEDVAQVFSGLKQVFRIPAGCLSVVFKEGMVNYLIEDRQAVPRKITYQPRTEERVLKPKVYELTRIPLCLWTFAFKGNQMRDAWLNVVNEETNLVHRWPWSNANPHVCWGTMAGTIAKMKPFQIRQMIDMFWTGIFNDDLSWSDMATYAQSGTFDWQRVVSMTGARRGYPGETLQGKPIVDFMKEFEGGDNYETIF